MMKKAQELNITYHPILDNFHEFDDVPRTEFNESLKFYLARSLTSGAKKIKMVSAIKKLLYLLNYV